MAEAGWYPDPGGGTQLRYFDGNVWTQAVRPCPEPEQAPTDGSTVSGTPVAGSRETEEPALLNGAGNAMSGPSRKGRRWLAVAAAFGAIAGIGAILVVIWGGDEQRLFEAASAAEDTDDEEAQDESEAPDEVELTEAEPAPEPATAREPVDLRERSWARHPWPTSCNALYEDIEATLGPSDVFELPGVLEFASSAGATPVVFSVWVDDVVYGDLTGDGHDEAVFETQCFHGNASEQMLEVWSLDDVGQPVLLPVVATWNKFTGVIESFTVVDGVLRVATAEGVPGDEAPHLNGYPVDVVTEWRFDGASWSATETSRSAPPVLAACIAPNSTPESAVTCLFEAVTSGDHGAALLVADVVVVQAFIDAHEEGWLDHWEFTGCGEPILLMPASDLACFFYDPPPEGSPFHGSVIELSVESASKGWFLTELGYVG